MRIASTTTSPGARPISPAGLAILGSNSSVMTRRTDRLRWIDLVTGVSCLADSLSVQSGQDRQSPAFGTYNMLGLARRVGARLPLAAPASGRRS